MFYFTRISSKHTICRFYTEGSNLNTAPCTHAELLPVGMWLELWRGWVCRPWGEPWRLWWGGAWWGMRWEGGEWVCLYEEWRWGDLQRWLLDAGPPLWPWTWRGGERPGEEQEDWEREAEREVERLPWWPDQPSWEGERSLFFFVFLHKREHRRIQRWNVLEVSIPASTTVHGTGNTRHLYSIYSMCRYV